jgi:hypothetical protein
MIASIARKRHDFIVETDVPSNTLLITYLSIQAVRQEKSILKWSTVNFLPLTPGDFSLLNISGNQSEAAIKALATSGHFE